MYDRLKKSLMFPRALVDYLSEKSIITWLYFLAFALVATIPGIISIVSQSNNAMITGDYALNLQKNHVEAIVENGKLNCQDDKTYYYVDTFELDGLSIPLYLIFDDSTNEITDTTFNYSLFTANTAIYVSFNESTIHIGIDSFVIVNMFDFTYDDLELVKYDFSNSSSEDYTNQITSFINSVYRCFLHKTLAINIISLIINVIVDAILSALFLALLTMLCYRSLHLSFAKAFKIVLLCSLPYFIFVMVAEATGISILSLIGEIILIFYASRLVFTNFIMDNIKIKIRKEPRDDDDSDDSGDDNEL